MELFGWLDVPTWLLGLVALITCLYLYGVWQHNIFKSRGIPGPKPYPLIGNFLDLVREGPALLHQQWIKKYGKVYGSFIGKRPSLTVADPEMLKMIMVKEFPNFTNRPLVIAVDDVTANAVSLIKDDHWRYVRSVLTPTFSSGKLKGMVPLIENCINYLEDNLEEKAKSGEEFDTKAIFGAYTMDVIASTAFGLDVNSQKNPNDPFVKHAKEAFNFNFASVGFALCFMFPFMVPLLSKWKFSFIPVKDRDFFVKISKAAIEDRRTNKTERIDLLQLMINAQLTNDAESKEETENLKLAEGGWQKKKGLTDMEIISQAVIFFIAGYETTALTVSFLAYCFATNPDCQQKAYEEIEACLETEEPNSKNIHKLVYLDMCISETLRLYPAATRVNRESKKDITINGWQIPKNIEINIPIYGIHHLPEFWPDPERFIPERFTPEAKAERHPFCYLPFGAGPRNCIGMRLALLEIKLAAAKFVKKFRFVTCKKTEVPIILDKSPFSRAKNGVWLKVEKR